MDWAIRQLAGTEAAARLGQLCDLLTDTVAGGASIGFLPPLARIDADAYWRGVGDALADGSRLLWVAEDQTQLLGSVQLDLCMRLNGLHRAEVSKLMVATTARRRGIGRALMGALEAHAEQIGRTTLVLDTRTGDPSELLYQGLGYVKSGEIPRYARSADGVLHTTAFYFKLLEQ